MEQANDLLFDYESYGHRTPADRPPVLTVLPTPDELELRRRLRRLLTECRLEAPITTADFWRYGSVA